MTTWYKQKNISSVDLQKSKTMLHKLALHRVQSNDRKLRSEIIGLAF